MGMRENVGKTFLFISLPLFTLLLYFELGYLMNYDIGECPIFGMTVYNTPCMVFSMVMFFLGIVVWILFLAGRLRTSIVVGTAYFSVTFFSAWTWVLSSKILALAGIFLLLIGLYVYPRDVETSRSLRAATSLVLYAFVFLVFVLSTVSYTFYFSWICGEAYSGAVAPLCSVLSYLLIGLGMASPFLWLKGRKVYAMLVLLADFLFMKFVIGILPFSGLVLTLTVILLALELSGGGSAGILWEG